MLLGIYPGVTQHMHHDAVMTVVATLGTFVPAEWLKSAHDGTLLGTGTHSIAWASWSWCWYYPHCTSTRHEWGDMTWWRRWALRLPMSDIYIGPVWCLVLWRELYSGAGNKPSQSFTIMEEEDPTRAFKTLFLTTRLSIVIFASEIQF